VTDQTLPDPLVPAEVDLRDFQYMELDVRVLRDSRFGAEVSGDAFRAGVMLWCASWHQVPAGSVPDDDVELANLAGYGRFVKEWKKARAQALQGFVKCSDGRLYHQTVCAKAAQAWESKLRHHFDRARDRLRKANKARAAQGQPELPELTFEAWNTQRLAGGVPMERADASAGIPPIAPPAPPGIPPENALRGNGEGTERRGNGEGDSIPAQGEAGPAPAGSDAVAGQGGDPPPAPPPAEDPPPERGAPNAYGLMARALMGAGLQRVSSGNVRFRALVDAGATADEFLAYADKAKTASDPFAYLLAAVEGERRRAAEAPPMPRAAPAPKPGEATGRLPEWKPEPPMSAEERARADEARRAAMARLGRAAA
jgi:hypothetical protein